LDPRMLYKVQNGDVLVLGQLRIVLESARPSVAPVSTKVEPAWTKPDAPKATRSAIKRAIDYLRNLSDKREVLIDLEHNTIQTSQHPNSGASDSLTASSDVAQTDPSLARGMYERTPQETPRVQDPPAEVSAPPEPPLAAATRQTSSWVLLLGIGVVGLQYVRIEVNGQLIVGYPDFETGVFAEL